MRSTSTEPKRPTDSLLIQDQICLDVLKQVHNLGAKLYNSGHHDHCLYFYLGAFHTIRPFMKHRPLLQEQIDSSITDVKKTQGSKLQAFHLHEVLEQLRTQLKELRNKNRAGNANATKPSPDAGQLSGKITLNEQPLGGAAILIVAEELLMPQAYKTHSQRDGIFVFPQQLPLGKYRIQIFQEDVPLRYQSTQTSSLVVTIRPGQNHSVLDLTS